jgi:hypothetical protein
MSAGKNGIHHDIINLEKVRAKHLDYKFENV